MVNDFVSISLNDPLEIKDLNDQQSDQFSNINSEFQTMLKTSFEIQKMAIKKALEDLENLMEKI